MSADELRRSARARAADAAARGEPQAWFEELYAAAQLGEADVPWADGRASPELVAWFDQRSGLPAAVVRGRALVVGCGFGDDAALLAQKGYEVHAIDVAPTAVARARARYAAEAWSARLTFASEDILAPADERHTTFDLVVEINTLQVLPTDLRERAIAACAARVAPGGLLFVAARGRDADDAPGALPWPLTWGELLGFEEHGLVALARLDHLDDETPPVRRFVALFQRRAAGPGRQAESSSMDC